jgi:Ca-activated chloride channel family protein
MTATRRALITSLSTTVALAACLAALTRAAPAQTPNARAAPQSAATPVGETRVFHLTAADEKGSPIPNLKRGDLTAFDGGEMREVVSFGSGDVPASVLFLVDASSSAFGASAGGLRARRLAALKESVSAFMAGGNPSNEYSVVAFDRKQQSLLEGSGDAREVLGALDRVAPSGRWAQTALYDALHLSLDVLAQRPARKRVLVLLSDGEDNVSKHAFADVLRGVKESDVAVYAVGVPVFDSHSELVVEARRIIDELTRTSGGFASYPESGAGMSDALRRIAAELRGQYEVSVSTTPRAKGDGWHEVKFKLASELRDAGGRKVKATLRTRRGFYDAGAPRKH